MTDTFTLVFRSSWRLCDNQSLFIQVLKSEQWTTCTFWPEQSFNFKNLKFMKQNVIFAKIIFASFNYLTKSYSKYLQKVQEIHEL